MKKKALVSLVLLAFVTAGAAFAQSPTLDKLKFTSTGLISNPNTTYLVSAANNQISGAVIIPDTYEVFISFSGGTAVFSDFARNISPPNWQDAKNKGITKVGDQYYRNLRSTGNLTWSGQVMEVTWNESNRNVAIGTRWANYTITITMSLDGDTITVSDGTTWIMAGIQ